MVESVDEPIEVLTLFQHGKLIPIRFRWKKRVVKVQRVTGDWVASSSGDRVHYFSVLGDGTDYFEIAYHTRKLSWILTRVWLGG